MRLLLLAWVVGVAAVVASERWPWMDAHGDPVEEAAQLEPAELTDWCEQCQRVRQMTCVACSDGDR